MSARNDLDCLLEKGLISQELYDILAPIVGITGDLSFALSIATGSALAGSILAGEPDSLVNVVVDNTTPVTVFDGGGGPIPEGITKAVVTPWHDGVMFTVTGDTPVAGTAHVLAKDLNYTFTPAEIAAAKFLALSAVSELSITYYK